MTGIFCLLIAVLLLCSPLIGVLYLDLPLDKYLEFPPETKFVSHAAFSLPVFLVLLVFIITVCFPVVLRLITYRATPGQQPVETGSFPWWGWAGILLITVFWVLAWNRFSFFRSIQAYTFTPLWIGYILAVNAFTCSRKGACLLCTRPVFYLLLFPVSSLFWWYFEYLNRFVQNWYYHTGADISATEYILHASISFSTVLPAILATYELLRTFPQLAYPFRCWHKVSFAGKSEAVGWLLLSLAVFSMAFLVVLPDYLFPMIWISPLFIIAGCQLIAGQPTIFSGLRSGDWRCLILPAVAALICGFFWEMWNWKSLAHWEYSIPFVDKFHLFAMPVLGYAGYLPFGIVCVAVVSLLDYRGNNDAAAIFPRAPGKNLHFSTEN